MSCRGVQHKRLKNILAVEIKKRPSRPFFYLGELGSQQAASPTWLLLGAQRSITWDNCPGLNGLLR